MTVRVTLTLCTSYLSNTPDPIAIEIPGGKLKLDSLHGQSELQTGTRRVKVLTPTKN